MSIKINNELCIGCGTCEALCPQTFKLDDTGKAKIIDENEMDCAPRAAESCPVQAIEVS